MAHLRMPAGEGCLSVCVGVCVCVCMCVCVRVCVSLLLAPGRQCDFERSRWQRRGVHKEGLLGHPLMHSLRQGGPPPTPNTDETWAVSGSDIPTPQLCDGPPLCSCKPCWCGPWVYTHVRERTRHAEWWAFRPRTQSLQCLNLRLIKTLWF